MALPKKYEGLEDALSIAAEIVSECTGIPGTGGIVNWGIGEVLKHFPIYTLKEVLNKNRIKALGISDNKRDFVIAQTRDALSSIDSVDYNPVVFRKEIFTKNCYFPTLIGAELVDNLHLGDDSDLLKAVRFVLATYLLHWSEEQDFPLEIRQEVFLLKSDVKKNAKEIVNIQKTVESLRVHIKKFEDARIDPIPVELTVIPKSVKNLIGRESAIQDITSKLEIDHILCITADGGLGKTAIVKEIINNIRNNIVKEDCKYKYVAWLTSSGNLKKDLLQINVPFFSLDDQEDKYKTICRFLQSNPTFLVIDNMDDLPTPDEINIINTIIGKSTILITSRSTIDKISSYELPSLDRDTAVALFYNHYFRNPAITEITHVKNIGEEKTGRIEYVYKIVDATGRNALTIELLAKTAHATVLKVAELWKKFDSDRYGYESKTEVQTDHSGKYSESMLSIDEQMRRLYSMLNLSDKQREILSFISLFPAENDIFSDVFKWAGFFDPDANDMMYLVDRGWIIRDDDYFSIHTIVRDSIKLQNKKTGDNITILNYKRLIKELSNIDKYIPRTLDYNLAQKLSFVPQHVGRLLSENNTTSATICEYFSKLAGLYKNQGNYEESLKYCKKALEIREKALGMQHPSIALLYNNIAFLNTAQGNYDEAIKFNKMALAIDEKILGKNHPATATIYNNIAISYKRLGNYEEAMKFHKMALEIREKALGKNHPDTASTYNNLACLYLDQGKRDEAMKYFKIALEIRDNVLGNDHPDTATTYNNIAGLYRANGNFDDAMEFYKAALEIRENKLGKDHPDTAITYNNFAGLYRDLGNFDDAMKFYKLALEIREKTLGKEHPDTATTYNNIATLYRLQNNYDESMRLYKLALEIREKALGKDHLSTAKTHSNIASLFKAQGNYEEALEHYKISLEIKEKILGKNHLDTAAVYSNIAVIYKIQGNYEEALNYYRNAIEIQENVLGTDNSSIATAYNNIAIIYKAQGNYDEAMKHYKIALEIKEKILGKNHPSTATTYSNLACLYKAQGNYEEALKFYKIALEIRENVLGIHMDTAATHERLAELYHDNGNHDEELSHLEKAREIKGKLSNK